MSYQIMKAILAKREPLDYEALRNALDELKLVYEVVPAKGMLDRKRRRVMINPAFMYLQAEILMHELLHWLFPVATEWFVRERARQLVYNDDELFYFLDRYCTLNAEDSTSGLVGIVGTPRR